MLLRGLIHDPDILVIDEPTGYMDAESVRLTWELLKDLKGKKSIIYVSNSVTEIEQAHDRKLVFHEGRIVMDGHLDKLLENTLDYHQFQMIYYSHYIPQKYVVIFSILEYHYCKVLKLYNL